MFMVARSLGTSCVFRFTCFNLELTTILSWQREQREELAGLLKKYGDTWEPWRNELARFKDNGDDVIAQAK